MFFQKFLVLLFRLENGLPDRRPFFEVDLRPGAHPEILGVDFHLLPSVVTNGVGALGPPGLGRRWAQHSHGIDIAAASIIGTLADSIFPGRGPSCAVLLRNGKSVIPVRARVQQ